MTTEEARVILAEEGEELTDIELRKIITTFELLAQVVIKKVIANES